MATRESGIVAEMQELAEAAATPLGIPVERFGICALNALIYQKDTRELNLARYMP